eukprot:TRINITY_DN1627_c0_g1_i7.p1 TRINITY_DN1627_c0_g1~~TRINITY_DN1627_c0_g1_i7.p1  ORF type:complete len:213 (-),score=27.60 TRINITY_DN1627_c0_g1_i7:18-656(-)
MQPKEPRVKEERRGSRDEQTDMNQENTDAEIKAWLTQIGMANYWEKFRDNGYVKVEYIQAINNKEDLIEIGITIPAHRVYILKNINQLKSFYDHPQWCCCNYYPNRDTLAEYHYPPLLPSAESWYGLKPHPSLLGQKNEYPPEYHRNFDRSHEELKSGNDRWVYRNQESSNGHDSRTETISLGTEPDNKRKKQSWETTLLGGWKTKRQKRVK